MIILLKFSNTFTKGKFPRLVILLLTFFVFSCSKKTVPHGMAPGTEVKKPIVEKKIRIPVPKVITVNDAVAQRNAEGKLYYDLNGKRYWRNNKDGKYYLFNKTMYNDPNFKP